MRIVVAALVLLTSGCVLWPSANSPRSGVRRTGEPLRIVDDIKVTTSVTRDKVAEIRYEDEAGQSLGRSDVYANRRHVNAELVWFPVQGYEVISDEDFFRISGDQKALDRTLARHARLKSWNRTGKIVALAGVASVVAATIIGDSAWPLVLGGALAISGGWYLSLWSHQQIAPEYHAVDRSAAVLAADRYNTGRGLSASARF